MGYRGSQFRPVGAVVPRPKVPGPGSYTHPTLPTNLPVVYPRDAMLFQHRQHKHMNKKNNSNNNNNNNKVGGILLTLAVLHLFA